MDYYSDEIRVMEKEQLEQSNLDNLIKELEIILGSIEMEKLGITENRIKFVKDGSIVRLDSLPSSGQLWFNAHVIGYSRSSR